MKKKLNIVLTALVVIALAGVSYYKINAQSEVPPMLERKGAIALNSEWMNTKKAIEGLLYQLRRDPEDQESRYNLALAYMQEARVTGEHPYYYNASMELLNEVLEETSLKNKDLYFQALTATASVQLSLHHFSDALKTGKEALKLVDHNASICGVLCDAYVELGNYPKAVEMADKMVSIRPDIRSYSRVSYLREIHGDADGAIEAMDMAVKAGMPGLEQTAWARVTLAKLFEKKGNLKMAEMHYQRTLDERPGYAFALAGLAGIEAKRKNFDKAIDLYKKASINVPEFSFKEKIAKLYKTKGVKSKATETGEELLEMLEEDQEAGHNMNLEFANIYLEIFNNYKKALEFALKEEELRPENIDVCYTLAKVYHSLGDNKKALAYARKAARTKKFDPEMQCLLGILEVHSGNKDKGQQLIESAFKTDPYLNEEFALKAKTVAVK